MIKIFDTTRSSLDAVQDSLDHRVVEQAATALTRPTKLSCLVSVHPRLLPRIRNTSCYASKHPATAVTGAINQRMVSASLSKGDCVICISYSGRTILLEESAPAIKQTGVA
jgi:RpiR family carbohydrate utilization transcriptional regulator